MKHRIPFVLNSSVLLACLCGSSVVAATARFTTVQQVPSAAPRSIPWRSGTVDPQPFSAETPLERIGQLAAGPQRHIVVQFGEAITDRARTRLRSAGIELLSFLGEDAYFAALSPQGIDLPSVATAASVVRAESVRAEWKLDPRFLDGSVPPHAIVGTSTEDGPLVAAYVVFHPDVQLETDGSAVMARYGTVRDSVSLVHALVVELPLASVVSLASEDAVQWIEPPLPRMGPWNDSNRARIGANVVQAAPYNLDGSGVSVLVYDVGTGRPTHQDFGGRLIPRDGSGMDDHSTHVAGTIGGSGAASNGLRKGMAPGVTLESFGYEHDTSGIILYTNPGDIQADYNQAINTLGVDIANNSIGSNVEPNGFACSIQGDYGVTDQLIDSIVRGSLGAPFRVIWADGNERQGSRCDVEGFGDFFSTAPPATAKNHITVGAVNSNDDTMTFFSSWGPTDDGRMKPDVCSAGDQTTDDFGVTSCSSAGDTLYSTKQGTSMAAPTVCGASALLLQQYRRDFPGSDPRNSTLKTLLAHTAVDLGNPGPDYTFGYGSVRITPAIDFMRLGSFHEGTVSQGGTVTYTVNVPAGTTLLKVTLAWDDFPGTPNVVPSKVNDLDVKVFSPTNVQSFPWTLNPSAPSASAVRTTRNSRDNLEQVLVDNPAAGLWRVEVFGFSVPQGPQVYSVCTSPNLDRALHVPAQFSTIQAAVDAAVTGDIVELAAGTYQGAGNRDVDFHGKSLTLRGSGPSTCTVDCQLLGRGLKIESVPDAAGVTVEGIRIINGSSSDPNRDDGGGIYCLNSTLRVRNCIIENCRTTVYGGAGIYFYTGFNENTLHTVDIVNCIVRNNTALSFTAGVGGGISISTARGIQARIRDCMVTGNTAFFGGAGIYLSVNPLVQPENCPVDIDGCTIANNASTGSSQQGGGIFSAHLDNSTGLTWIRNSILWGNTASAGSQVAIFDGILAMVYSDLQGGIPGIYIGPGCGGPPCSGGGFFANGIGVINLDPQFKNPGAFDFHIRKTSPCMHAGDPGFVPLLGETDIDGEARLQEARVEMGADERFSGTMQQPPP
jgi:hypothetical protein